jgi:hypothetical protein
MASLVEFKLAKEQVILVLVSESIPIVYINCSNGANRLLHPAHNNGGFNLHKSETYEVFLKKMEKAVESYLIK